ncbi:dienelactone hydrolase family protein [Trujillonella endophytica]|uniref:Carboxymethylenebutenolidase n=1 Tax=Trujillonella endophytica TaxID=673521 RepID=A0A1H8R004_9ACTN|nr:dienelactone hydrolase family protein [Trujillella endophytica]SEO59448.1 carboxymethylenebutenolidase [Trujillella endophytica]
MDTHHSVHDLPAADGGSVPTLVVRPPTPGPHPAVILGVEAYGPNRFATEVATRLAEAGHVVVVPDYYRGAGPGDPEAYTDFTEVMRFIDALDFRRGTRDLLTAVAYAAGCDDVDPDRIAVWGYCTGGTLALLAAELSDRIAAAVLFFPSQPWFAELTPRTPVHPVDLLWALRCPALFLYGDRDPVLPPERLEDLRDRLAGTTGGHRLLVSPDAGHAFCAPVAPLRDDAADRASWADATAFLRAHLSGSSGVGGTGPGADA